MCDAEQAFGLANGQPFLSLKSRDNAVALRMALLVYTSAQGTGREGGELNADPPGKRLFHDHQNLV